MGNSILLGLGVNTDLWHRALVLSLVFQNQFSTSRRIFQIFNRNMFLKVNYLHMHKIDHIRFILGRKKNSFNCLGIVATSNGISFLNMKVAGILLE